MVDHNHHSNHNHGNLSANKLLFSIVLNIVITVSQFIGGFISGSLALMSDATHNLTDVISLIISYIAAKLKNKKQTVRQTFGYKRAEIIAAFVNAISLIILAVFLGIEAIDRFNSPKEIETDYVIWLAIIAIVANFLSVFLIAKDAKNNINMRSAYLHLMSDALVSVAVLVGGLLMKYYSIFWIDAALTLAISVYLLYLSIDILIESTRILMLFTPKGIKIEDLEKSITSFKDIKNLHHVHLWQLNDHDIYIEAHIEFSKDIKLSEWDLVCTQIEEKLHNEFSITHSMLQPEFSREDEKEIIIQD